MRKQEVCYSSDLQNYLQAIKKKEQLSLFNTKSCIPFVSAEWFKNVNELWYNREIV